MPLLFSYGTLQQEAVQLATFGRLLAGQPDELTGFEQSVFTIADPEFVAASGKGGSRHRDVHRESWQPRERHGIRDLRERARKRGSV